MLEIKIFRFPFKFNGKLLLQSTVIAVVATHMSLVTVAVFSSFHEYHSLQHCATHFTIGLTNLIVLIIFNNVSLMSSDSYIFLLVVIFGLFPFQKKRKLVYTLTVQVVPVSILSFTFISFLSLNH